MMQSHSQSRKLCAVKECVSFAVIGKHCKKHHADPIAPCGKGKTGVKTAPSRAICEVVDCVRIAMIGKPHCDKCSRDLSKSRGGSYQLSAWKGRLRMGKMLNRRAKDKARSNFEPERIHINPAIFK